jgi:hypothetical protein
MAAGNDARGKRAVGRRARDGKRVRRPNRRDDAIEIDLRRERVVYECDRCTGTSGNLCNERVRVLREPSPVATKSGAPGAAGK